MGRLIMTQKGIRAGCSPVSSSMGNGYGLVAYKAIYQSKPPQYPSQTRRLSFSYLIQNAVETEQQSELQKVLRHISKEKAAAKRTSYSASKHGWKRLKKIRRASTTEESDDTASDDDRTYDKQNASIERNGGLNRAQASNEAIIRKDAPSGSSEELDPLEVVHSKLHNLRLGRSLSPQGGKMAANGVDMLPKSSRKVDTAVQPVSGGTRLGLAQKSSRYIANRDVITLTSVNTVNHNHYYVSPDYVAVPPLALEMDGKGEVSNASEIIPTSGQPGTSEHPHNHAQYHDPRRPRPHPLLGAGVRDPFNQELLAIPDPRNPHHRLAEPVAHPSIKALSIPIS